MVNNFTQIRELLDFRSDDDFYFCQILQRKKDHKQGKVNGTNNSSRLIKAYYIKSKEHLDFIEPEIKELCKIFNARAGINLNRRSFKRTQLQTMKLILDQQLNNVYNKTHRAFNSVCGRYSNESDKKWIIDIDEQDMNLVDDITDLITNIQPYGNKDIALIPSKNGWHLVTNPFNLQDFKKQPESKEVSIHKNNPTNLYIE